ncbi:MAG: hypothetical protein QM484_10545 [Woeseiaceae bacterium]
MSKKFSIPGLKRLEITMRDVIDGLEDAASYMNYQSQPDVVEILSIEPLGRTTTNVSNIAPFLKAKNTAEKADIAAYLIKREGHKSA